MSRAYPDRPFVGVGMVVFRADTVLLVRRGQAPRAAEWSIPGGAQEIGETVREAGLRELREETGIEAEIIGLIDVVDAITRDDRGMTLYHYTLVDFAAEWRSGEPVAGHDASDARFTDLAALESIDLWDQTRRIIGQAKALRRARRTDRG